MGTANLEAHKSCHAAGSVRKSLRVRRFSSVDSGMHRESSLFVVLIGHQRLSRAYPLGRRSSSVASVLEQRVITERSAGWAGVRPTRVRRCSFCGSSGSQCVHSRNCSMNPRKLRFHGIAVARRRLVSVQCRARADNGKRLGRDGPRPTRREKRFGGRPCPEERARVGRAPG